MFCVKCGNQIKDGFKFCPKCGTPAFVEKEEPKSEIKKEEVVVTEVCNCPNCKGKIIERKSRKGKLFYGCNNYPKCKTAYWDKPIGRSCPECSEMLVEKNGKIKCSSCDYAE